MEQIYFQMMMMIGLIVVTTMTVRHTLRSYGTLGLNASFFYTRLVPTEPVWLISNVKL